LLPLIGDFQYDHAAASIKALKLIDPSLLDNIKCISDGLKNISLLGRYQVLSVSPEIILDVAHNEDSAQKLQENLNKSPATSTIAIVGILKDKDVYSLIKPMIDIVDKWYCVTINSVRGMNAQEIKTRMSTLVSKEKIYAYDSMQDATSKVISQLNKDSRLIVYGSFYTVSEYLSCHKSSNIGQASNNEF
jgi:dihydrofolate synthase/folylpolyglutamate synthase